MLILCKLETNAKLTIAYVTMPDEYEYAYYLSDAKLRQAVIKVAGEDWFKQFMARRIETSRVIPLIVNIGNDCDLILQARNFWDEESMLMVKKAFDYLSEKNDTLVYAFERGFNLGEHSISYILNYGYPYKLIVGKFFQEDLAYNNYIFFITSAYWGKEYIQECKANGFLPIYLKTESNDSENRGLEQKDMDFYFDFMMKEDKKLLSKPLRTKPKVMDFSYNYDKRAGIRYIEEHLIHYNDIDILPYDPLDVNVDDMIDEILNRD